MEPTLDLSIPHQKRKAEYGAAERVCSELIPCLFHDSDKKPWIRLIVDGHFETLAIDSPDVADFLKRKFWEEMKQSHGSPCVMPPKLLKERLDLLSSIALFEGEKQSVALRVGENSGIHYIDLCDDQRRVVRITSDRWDLEDQSSVFFLHTPDMLPLPVPERGGSIDELKPFLNSISPDQFVLVKGWILVALRSRGPYLMMALIGAAGTAKSTFCRMLRALVDPDKIPLSGPPRDARDLNVLALDSHLLGFDNISALNPKLSDALCRTLTGAGNKERQYYTNKGMTRFPHVSRPVIINGISEFLNAADLLDRSIVLHLPHIKTRRMETDLWRDFNSKSGRIFGGILDHMVEGVRNFGSGMQSTNLRMADAITWCTACGLKDFESCFRQSLIDTSYSLIEHDKVPVGVKALMRGRKEPWESNSEALGLALRALNHDVPENPRELADHLRKIEPALRSAFGIDVEFVKRKGQQRPIRISNVSSSSSSASPHIDESDDSDANIR